MELLGTGWHLVVQECDRDVTDQVSTDLTAGRAGQYIVRTTARMGDQFILNVRTVVNAATGQARGSAVIQGHILKRRYFPITNAVRKKGII